MDENNKIELTMDQLNAVAGGDADFPDTDGLGDSRGVTINDQNGEPIATFNTFEEAKFFVTGLCPRCGKTYASETDRLNHIKAWASGQK